MKVVIAVIVYVAIAAAQTAVIEEISDYNKDYDVPWPTIVSIVWPLTAPFLFVKFAIARLLKEKKNG